MHRTRALAQDEYANAGVPSATERMVQRLGTNQPAHLRWRLGAIRIASGVRWFSELGDVRNPVD